MRHAGGINLHVSIVTTDGDSVIASAPIKTADCFSVKSEGYKLTISAALVYWHYMLFKMG